jgi:hypothetical protein
MAASTSELERISVLVSKLTHEIIEIRLRAIANLSSKFKSPTAHSLILTGTSVSSISDGILKSFLLVRASTNGWSVDALEGSLANFQVLDALLQLTALVSDKIPADVAMLTTDTFTRILDELYTLKTIEQLDPLLMKNVEKVGLSIFT